MYGAQNIQALPSSQARYFLTRVWIALLTKSPKFIRTSTGEFHALSLQKTGSHQSHWSAWLLPNIPKHNITPQGETPNYHTKLHSHAPACRGLDSHVTTHATLILYPFKVSQPGTNLDSHPSSLARCQVMQQHPNKLLPFLP